MKRRPWLRVILACALLGTGALCLRLLGPLALNSSSITIQAGGCTVPLTYVKAKRGAAISAVVFHGLGGNRGVMRALGHSLALSDVEVYLVDFPGHGDSSEPFTFGRAEECAAAVVGTLAQQGKIKLERILLVGHSFGGAVAVRLADRFPTAATVAISPAPMVLPRRMPVNLLVFSAQYDLPQLRQTAAELLRAAGGVRDTDEDVRQKRGVRYVVVPRAQHASLLLDRIVWGEIDRWWRRAVPTDLSNHFHAFTAVVLGTALGAAGLMMLFPLAASGVAAAFRARGSERQEVRQAVGRVLLEWAVAGMFAAGVLKFWVPLGALGIYNGDYLASFLLVAGIVLAVMGRQRAWQAMPIRVVEGRGVRLWRGVGMAAVVGLGAAMAFGGWMNWELTDAWPNAARWWRFAVLVFVFVPYLWAEERALGAPEKKERGPAKAGPYTGPDAGRARTGWRRWGMFLAMRGMLWLAMMFGLFVLESGAVLMLLFVLYMTTLSVLQRMGSDAVYKRTGSALAAAVFGAIVAAWFVASVFPIT